MLQMLLFTATMFVLIALFISCNSSGSSGSVTTVDFTSTKWWKEITVYQIYPRNFKDADGDGVGNMNGIITKLDYIISYGIECISQQSCYLSNSII